MKEYCRSHRILFMLVFSGLLTGVTLIFPSLGFLQWVSIVPAAVALLYSAEEEIRFRKIYGRGLLFFWSYYAVVFHWFFYMYPLDFAGLSNFLSIIVVILACFGISLLQALISAFAFVVVAYILRGKIFARAIMTPIVAAAVWVVAEWVQTVGWWGVPWGRLPLGQSECLILLRSSAVLGSYFVTFVIVAVNFCIAYIFLHKETWRIASIVAVSFFTLNIVLGVIVTLSYREDGYAVRVAALQGNIATNEKWDENSLDKTLYVYDSLTVAAAANGAEIVLFPETALPYSLLEEPRLMYYVSSLAEDNDITVLVSAFTHGENYELYNSVIEIKPDGSVGEIYSKQKLVPFGEYVPMRALVQFLFPPLAEIGMLDDDVTAGDESAIIDSDVGKIGCAVCFDSIYEGVVRRSVLDGAKLITVSTNDSWFGDSAALNMHNSQSRLRAIETGRYVLRSANTGISAVIDPMGNVREELGALKTGYVLSDVYMRNNKTVYTLIGNLFVMICAAYTAVCLAATVYDKRIFKFLNKS